MLTFLHNGRKSQKIKNNLYSFFLCEIEKKIFFLNPDYYGFF